MKLRYRLFQRNNGIFFIEDRITHFPFDDAASKDCGQGLAQLLRGLRFAGGLYSSTY